MLSPLVDRNDEATWAPALRSISAVYLTYYPDLAIPRPLRRWGHSPTCVFTEVLDGHNAYLTDGVQRALGRVPRDFADYARDDAATGIWDAR